EVVGQESSGPKLAPARHLRGDPDVLRHVDPGNAVGGRAVRANRAAGKIIVGDPGKVEAAGHGYPGPDRQARVHLDQLQRAVAGVADELDVRESLVADLAEEPQPLLLDLGLAPRLEDRARPEAQRALADLAAGDVCERLPVTADVGEQ